MRYLAAPLFLLIAGLSGPVLAAGDSGLDGAVARLADRWATITYQTHDMAREEREMTALSAESEKLAQDHPNAASPLIWDGIIKYSVASYVRGLKGFGLVKQAKVRFEQALALDPRNSVALANLGFLYYQVPGFPIGFGSDKKARQFIEQSLAIAPDDIDANYFYGDFLAEKGQYQQAKKVLEHGLALPTRPDHAVADEGRRGDIRTLLDRIARKLSPGA